MAQRLTLKLAQHGARHGAQCCAVVGGMLLLGIMLTTCASVVGRNLLGQTLIGDFELTGMACGVAIAMFMPWCQLRRGHILVDFFTAQASPKTTDALNRAGTLALALCMLGLAWRTALGGLSAHGNFSTSMLLGLPHWWVYAGMLPPMLLTAVIALLQVFKVLRPDAATQ